MSDILRWRRAALDEGGTRLPQHKRDEATDRWDRIVAHAGPVHPHIEDLDGGQSDAAAWSRT